MQKLLWFSGLIALAACSHDSATGPAAQCPAVAQAAPANVTMSVLQTITVSMTLKAGCPVPIVRNETPTVLQVDVLSSTELHVTGRIAGDGRLRVRSGVDTMVSTVVSIAVIP